MKRHHPGFYSMATPRPVIEPVGEHGYLTPVRATAGSASTWIWTCRCGATVTREARMVRKSVRDGRVPKCSPKCMGERQQEQPGAEVAS